MVVHTSHLAYGYLIRAARKRIVWAPEFFAFPAWAEKVDLMFAEAAGWKRPIHFVGGVGWARRCHRGGPRGSGTRRTPARLRTYRPSDDPGHERGATPCIRESSGLMKRSIVLVEKGRLPAFLGFMEILVGVILLAQRKARRH
jgi:hypothetical protein